MSDTGVFYIDGASLEWRACGDAAAPSTIVLLHEGLGCVGLWLDFPNALASATGLRVVAFSRAGYGQSSPVVLPRPLDYMTREAQDVLPNVLDAIGAARVVLVGHSDGATIAAIHAGTVPDGRVEGVVLIAPHFFTEPMGLAAIAQARDAYEAGPLRERLARWHKDVDCAFRGWNDAWLDSKFRAWNVEHVLPGIKVPVCVVQGDADAYGTVAQVEAVTRSVNAPVETHILPGVGHSPHREARDSLASIIARFVRSVR